MEVLEGTDISDLAIAVLKEVIAPHRQLQKIGSTRLEGGRRERGREGVKVRRRERVIGEEETREGEKWT